MMENQKQLNLKDNLIPIIKPIIKLTEQKRDLVTSELLGKVIVPDLPFENVDGSAVRVDTDYFGKKRNPSNPAPGPIETWKNGEQKIKVWPKK